MLRRFLLDQGQLPDKPLVAMVPVSVHDKSDRPGRNQVSGMFCRLETHIDHAGERLKAIAREAEPRAARRRGPATSEAWPVQRVGEVERSDPPGHLDPR